MGAYASNFKRDLDDMWLQFDFDNNGVLDRRECKGFVDELVKNIGADRAKNYNRLQFDYYFNKFDDNSNGFIEKTEMAGFIKQVFATGQPKYQYRGRTQ